MFSIKKKVKGNFSLHLIQYRAMKTYETVKL